MNRRVLLGATAAAVLCPVNVGAAGDDVESFQRQFMLDGLDFEQPIFYYFASLLGPSASTAKAAYKAAKGAFIDTLVESLEDDEYTVTEEDQFTVRIDRFDDEDVLSTGYSFTVSSNESSFDIYVKAIVATRKRVVNAWASVSLDDSTHDLVDLADEYMKFTATRASDLPNMMPDEFDMPNEYELSDEGEIEDVGDEF